MVAADVIDPDQSANSFAFNPRDLTPASFPHPTVQLDVHETHISWVVLTGPFAYKIKKSVRFDFLDASTLERRHDLCEEELRLNRRLADDIYVDVVPIIREAEVLRVGGRATIVEYAVRMKQFEAAQELPALLARGAVSGEELIDLAVRLAEFHRRAPVAPVIGDFPHTRELYEAVLGNLATALIAPRCPDASVAGNDPLVDWTHAYLHDSLATLRSREQHGAIRECHGDLHARQHRSLGGPTGPFRLSGIRPEASLDRCDE